MLMGVTVPASIHQEKNIGLWLHYKTLKFITMGYWGIALNTLSLLYISLLMQLFECTVPRWAGNIFEAV